MLNDQIPLDSDEVAPPQTPSRRKLLVAGVFASLVAAYGTLTSFALAFVFPSQTRRPVRRIFIGFADELAVGASKSITMPSGDQMIVSNTGTINLENNSTFTGFSNRCPHLGCRVHWDGSDGQFICPCHQGVFNAEGVATAGPPAQANQVLRAYSLDIKGNSMYALVEDV